MTKVTIAMPAYHAAATLERTVGDIPIGLAGDLLLVDDASGDGTAELSRRLGIRTYVHDRNRGYGANQKTCYLRSLENGADVVVMLHPDYQYDPKAVPLLLAPIMSGDADMTFGSRFAGLGDPRAGGMPLYRFLGNRVTTMAENLMLGARFTDMHSGMRAYTRECLMRLPFRAYSDDFWFDSELLVDAVVGGLRVVEVPIPTRYSEESSSISVSRSLRYVCHSVGYCAHRTALHGRRGRRRPVARAAGIEPEPAAAPPPSAAALVDQTCVLCGHAGMVVVLPGNAVGALEVEEFACTSDRLNEHDDILRCPRCGMVSARATVSRHELVEQYEQTRDDAYLAELEARRELFGWVLDRVDAYALPGRRLFEAGSNMGVFLSVAGDRGWAARGVEPSRWAVDRGRELFGVELVQGTAEDAGEAPASADVVVLLDVLEHLADPVAGLAALRRIVADEGLVVLTTINVESLHARLRGGSWPWYIRPHVHYFTPETLSTTMRRAGFSLVEYTVVPRWFHLSYVAERGASNLGLASRLAGRMAGVWDPRLPVGLLGDVVLAIGRPVAAGSPE